MSEDVANKSIIPETAETRPAWAMPVLALGAAAIGLSPILVRLSEVGPVAAATNRMALSLPFFVLMALAQPRDRIRKAATPRMIWLLALSGVFFAGDLGLWHWSIKLTSVANSTVITNLAPVAVVLGAWMLFGEKPSRKFLAGLLSAIAGVFVLLGDSFTLSMSHMAGDLLAVFTSMFYGSYLLAMSRARRETSTAVCMAAGGLVATVILWIVAAATEGQVWPTTTQGWMVAFALALVIQVGGQAMIAASFAHVPAGFGSMVLLLQPLVAAVIAWIWFDEPLSVLQGVGAAAILGGVEIARRASLKPK